MSDWGRVGDFGFIEERQTQAAKLEDRDALSPLSVTVRERDTSRAATRRFTLVLFSTLQPHSGHRL